METRWPAPTKPWILRTINGSVADGYVMFRDGDSDFATPYVNFDKAALAYHRTLLERRRQ